MARTVAVCCNTNEPPYSRDANVGALPSSVKKIEPFWKVVRMETSAEPYRVTTLVTMNSPSTKIAGIPTGAVRVTLLNVSVSTAVVGEKMAV